MNAQIRHCLSNLSSGSSAKAALKAYSSTLTPLGEALTEFGRMRAEITYYSFATHPRHHDNPSELELPRRQVDEAVTGCCEAADEILEVTAIELRDAAIQLAPSPSRLQPIAPVWGRARPGYVTGSHSGPSTATSPPPVAPSGGANGRHR
ncbi:hypothetical protein ACFTZM_08000 [Streptomyces hydrogenans]|uniref:hypothetical protein n=1 Tax=Streptomyces hydrogenans TaxID=1873719 RepID=UPI00362B2444